MSVCNLPDGDARYAAMLKFHCDVDLTPEQMHQIGHEQVKLVRNKIEQVGLNQIFRNCFINFLSLLSLASYSLKIHLLLDRRFSGS